MTEYSRESLEKLLRLIKEISGNADHVWFKEALWKINPETINISELQDIHSDLRRTKSFLRHIDGQFWREGFLFYKRISDVNLKIALTSDFKEMRIAQSENNYIEYGRRLILQFENILNFLIIKFDAFQIISSSPQQYINGKTNLYVDPYGFFKSESERKSIAQISLPTKLNWARIYFEFNYDFKLFQDMNFIRNKASHGQGALNTLDAQKLKEILTNWELSKIEKLRISTINNLILHI